MGTIYVARSQKLSKWGADVGLSKHVYKLGCTDEKVKPMIVAARWAGEDDWTLVRGDDAAGLTEEEVLARIGRKEKAVDPRYYPRIRDATGIFKIDPVHVESHLIVGRALDGTAERDAIKLKPADFASYLIHNALR
jgi:hypothetical protein